MTSNHKQRRVALNTKAGIAGHPSHPMLAILPIGLWVFSFAADLIYAGTHNTAWVAVAYYTIALGIIGALPVAVPGAIGLFSITRGHTRRTDTWHMLINVTVLVLFAINLWQRSYTREITSGLIWLSGIGVALLVVSGWLGGEMVYRRAVTTTHPPGAVRNRAL